MATSEQILEEIAAEVKVCTACDLYKGTKNAVPGAGNPHAEVMLIGEAPGFNEDRQGLPFVGAAGQFLDELLGEVGLRRSDVFIANVVKHRPPDNRDPLPEEIKACSGYLTRQIAAINPKVIVTLGRYSMARFFDDARISKIHGQIKLVDGRVIVAMYHPAAALHQQTLRQTLIDDFRAAVPAALELARKGAADGGPQPVLPAEDKSDTDAPPPEQLSLF
jgi:uracil-DNA glycosylase family 4